MDESRARAALEIACSEVGLDPDGSELIRLGSNAVFRLRAAAVVARVAPSQDRLADAERQVHVARWLAGEDVPAIRALAVDQPVVADGRVVTFWESAADRTDYGTTTELAVLLRHLHALTPPDSLQLPALAPFGRAMKRIEQAPGLSDPDRTFLRDRATQLAGAFGELRFELPAGVIHGDASVGNVIRDRQGRSLLADLDGVAVGPREWDLVLTALYHERFGWHTADEYAAFVEAYRYDVMAWPGYSVLADVRELLMVIWLSQNAATDSTVAEELATRICDLRTGSSRRAWQPF